MANLPTSDLIIEDLDPKVESELDSRGNPKMLQPYTFIQGTFLPKKFAKYSPSIRNMEVRNDDVWILTYIKAGTHWTKEMVWLILHGDFETAKRIPGMHRAPFFEHDAINNSTPDRQKMLESGIPTTMEMVVKMESPRIITSHLPVSLLPKELGEKKPKIIYVARNPKDVAVSHYHHRVLIEGYLGTLDNHVEEFVNHRVIYSPYWPHILQGWKMRNDPNFLFLTYEDMKKDLGSVIDKTASFLGKSVTHEQKLRLLDHLSFESMKQNPSINCDVPTEALIKVHGVERKTHFIRKGQVGSWKEELSPESNKMLDEWIARNKIEGLWDDLI